MSRPLDFEALLTTRDFEQGIRNIENQIRNLTQQTERETSQMDSLFRNLATGIGAYFSVQALQGFTQQLINVRGEFQKTEIAFATMLGSQEKAQNLMAEMVDLAAKTPFGLQEISEGAKQLLAFQIPAEEVVDTLTRMGDVAAGLGVPMGQLIHVYGQVKAQGKLMTNDLYQFMNAGIPILSELGSVLGKTEAEVKEMVGQGKIGFSEIQQVIQNMTNEGGLFFNLMEKQSASLSGQIERLKDAWAQMLNEIGKDNESALYSGIEGLAKLIDNYKEVARILAVLISSYGAYRAAVILTSIAQNSILNTQIIQGFVNLTKVLQGATVAQNALNAASLANPYIFLATAFVGIVTALGLYKDELRDLIGLTKEASAETKTQDAIMQEFDNNFSKGVANKTSGIQELIYQIKSEYSTLEQRKTAYEQLIKVDSAFQNTLDGQYKATYKLGEAFSYVVSKMNQMVMAQAEMAVKKKYYEEYFENKTKLGILEIKKEESKKNEKKVFMIGGGSKIEGEQETKKIQKEIDDITKKVHDSEKIISVINKKQAKEQQELLKLQTKKVEELTKEEKKRKEILQQKYKIEKPSSPNTPPTPTSTDKKKKKKGGKKELAEIYSRDSIKDLEERISLWNNALERADSNGNVKVRAKDKYGKEYETSTIISVQKALEKKDKLEKLLEKKKKELEKNSWQEELSELERQWKVRYQIAKHYGEEIAKVQFPNLKGESYFDEIKNRYEALDKKQSSGSKLSNEEIEQWQKLKDILDNLQGTKDPFTNWKEHLEQTLSGFETFTQKIEYLQTQIENLTPEQKSQGYEAVLREQLANAEKEYQQFYDNFLKEQQTFEEKKIAIEKKYADLSAKAKNDAQKNAIEKAKSNELTDLFFEETQKSDQWAKIFTDMNAVASSSLEKFKTILQEKLKDAKGVEEKAKIGEFIKKIDEQLENRRGLDFSKRFKEIKNDIQAFVTAKKAVTEAQKEYNKAVADFGKNSAEAQKKEQELSDAEQKRTDAQAGLNKKLGDLGSKTSKYAKIGIDAVNDIREAFDDLGVSLDNDFGDTLDKLQQSFEGINKTAEGAAQFASGDYVGGTIKMIGGIIKTFSGWFNNDKKKERAIKREKEALDSLKNTYEELSHAIDRVFKAKEYSDQTKLIQNLEQQKIHLQNMIRQEGAKKKSDQGKITDWQNQINQINRSIIDLKDNLVKDVLQTDLSNFATKIGDALVDAFGRGANAAKDLEKVAGDVLKNMLKHQLDLMLQKRYSGTLERLFKATGLNDDGTGTFKGISCKDQERFKEEIKNGSQISNSFLEGYKEIFAGIGEDNESLKGAIKGMSEQTADVLVGQFNAIRINTGEIMKYSIFNVETLKSSLQVLNQIEENTRNLYQMRKDISDMNSKISSKGNSLRANGID